MLPEKWIGRIFDYMLALYGSKFSDLWKGTDPEAVRRVWAEKLAGFDGRPDAIKAALNALDERPFPPTLPEFITLCRDAARRPTAAPALPHRLTPEEQARADEAARKVKAAFDPEQQRDHLAWAKKPRSSLAFNAVMDLAKKGDDRFRGIIDDLVKQGVTDGHKLLKAWNGTEWVKA